MRAWQVLILSIGVLSLSASGRAATLNDYYRLKTKNPPAARQALTEYVSKNPSDTEGQLEMAYVLINEKNYPEAAAHLETAHKAEPDNSKVSIQLAYVYQNIPSAGDEARVMFQSISKSGVNSSSTTACQALVDMAGSRLRFLPAPFFADAYINPLYLSRFDDFVFSSQLRAGVAVGKDIYTEFYGSVRYIDDSESASGPIPEILSDNVVIYGVGFRTTPLKKVPLSIYGEVGEAHDLIDQNRNKVRDDYRGGLTYYDRWAPLANCAPNWRMPLKRSSSLYGDLSVYSRYDNNWIGYAQWREGLRLVEKGRMATDAFLYLGGSADSNNVYYNNTAEIGVGASFQPDQAWPLVFRYTAVRGAYINIGSAVPTDREYTDHRWEAIGYLRF